MSVAEVVCSRAFEQRQLSRRSHTMHRTDRITSRPAVGATRCGQPRTHGDRRPSLPPLSAGLSLAVGPSAPESETCRGPRSRIQGWRWPWQLLLPGVFADMAAAPRLSLPLAHVGLVTRSTTSCAGSSTAPRSCIRSSKRGCPTASPSWPPYLPCATAAARQTRQPLAMAHPSGGAVRRHRCRCSTGVTGYCGSHVIWDARRYDCRLYSGPAAGHRLVGRAGQLAFASGVVPDVDSTSPSSYKSGYCCCIARCGNPLRRPSITRPLRPCKKP